MTTHTGEERLQMLLGFKEPHVPGGLSHSLEQSFVGAVFGVSEGGHTAGCEWIFGPTRDKFPLPYLQESHNVPTVLPFVGAMDYPFMECSQNADVACWVK